MYFTLTCLDSSYWFDKTVFNTIEEMSNYLSSSKDDERTNRAKLYDLVDTITPEDPERDVDLMTTVKTNERDTDDYTLDNVELPFCLEVVRED